MKFDQIKRNATTYPSGIAKGVQVLEFAPRIKGDLTMGAKVLGSLSRIGNYPRVARLLNPIEVPAPVLPPMETC